MVLKCRFIYITALLKTHYWFLLFSMPRKLFPCFFNWLTCTQPSRLRLDVCSPTSTPSSQYTVLPWMRACWPTVSPPSSHILSVIHITKPFTPLKPHTSKSPFCWTQWWICSHILYFSNTWHDGPNFHFEALCSLGFLDTTLSLFSSYFTVSSFSAFLPPHQTSECWNPQLSSLLLFISPWAMSSSPRLDIRLYVDDSQIHISRSDLYTEL